MSDPKEAARRIMSGCEDKLDAVAVARALLAGEGPVPEGDKLWIGVNSLGVPDLATLHVDERDCRELIDKIVQEEGDVILVPRRCILTIGASSPSPAVRDVTLREAYATLGAAFSRIHCLPRTTDTVLANRIAQTRALIEAALSHPSLPDGEAISS